MSTETPQETVRQIKPENANLFTSHRINDKGAFEVTMFKTSMTETVNRVLALMPEGREKSVFKTKLEEAVFFGTKAIAAKDGNYTEKIEYGGEPQ